MSDPLDEGRAAASGEEVYPSELRDRDWWVNWLKALPYRDGSVDTEATPTKQPVAPYDTGHARPVRWHSGLDDDEHPSTAFLDVVNWDGLRAGTDVETADRVVSKEVGIGVIIPVGGGDGQPITLLDWDDVRDPETGDVHPVCADVLQRYDGFAEISQSGEGIHQFVFGEIPGGLSKFLRHIDDEPFVGDSLPMLEMYSSGRLTAMTGDHVAGTGQDVVEGQALIDELTWRFGTADNNSPGTPTDPHGRRSEGTEASETPSHEAVGEALREAAAYDGDHPDEWDVPDEWSLRYAAVVRAREHADEYASIANWELNGYAGALGYHDGRALDDVIADLRAVCDDDDLRREVRQAYRKAEAGNYEPVSRATLASRGLLPDEYDEPRGWTPSYDVTAEAEAVTGATDGGTEAAVGGDSGPGRSTFERFKSDVRAAIAAVEDDDEMTQRTARHRIAQALVTHYNFVHPEEEVRGWRTSSPSKTIIYVYDDGAGIYEPRGKTFIEQKLEAAAADYTTNQVVNEVVSKVKRMTTERGEQFKRSPERLVVGNGVLNLYAGELDPYTPTEYHRQKIDIDWNPDAGEPAAIDEFLHDIVETSDVPTLYRLISHTLLKEYVGEKAAILIGGGQNGKSVFLDFVEEFIGPYNVTHRELQDFDDDGFAANNLEGKLANLATEIGERQLNDTTTFKKLTGRDTLDARVKYEGPVTFENFATMMFATNEMPTFAQDNHAIWRRWVYVDFPYTFDASDETAKDPVPKQQLMRRLTEESQLQALLLRCQQEIQRWHENVDEEFFADAMPPEQVRDKMKKAAEPVYNFASVCLDVGDADDTFVEKSIVRAVYRAYAAEEDLPTIPENEFGSRLIGIRDLQIESSQRKVDGSYQHVYNGIELSSRGRQVLGLDRSDDEGQTEVDDAEQATAIVMDELRAMVEKNDNQPVPRDGLVWRVAGDVGKVTAENAVEALIHDSGRVMEGSDGLLPTE